MPTTYPLDPTGSQSTNRITGEQHIITPVNYKDYSFIVPKLAPFFATNLQITFRDQDNNVIQLEEGVDWYLSHWFISASRACSKPIYGSISFLNKTLNGVVTLNYNTLGGDWNIDETLIAQILADRLHNPRTTSWDSVSEMPYAFPVIDHEWDLVDMVGMSDVVERLDEISAAILAGGEGDVTDHIANLNNPHQTNKHHVGLSNVQNFPVADQPIATAGDSNAHYMTPRSTKQAYDAFNSPNATHISNTDNPHGVTAAQTGAYSKSEMDDLLLQKLSTTGTAFNSDRLGGLTPEEYAEEVLRGTADNASRLEGRDFEEAKAEILEGTAADSERFNGMGYLEMADFIRSLANQSGTAATQGYRAVFVSENPSDINSWTPIARVSVRPNLDAGLIVFGGSDLASPTTASFHLRISTTDGVSISMEKTALFTEDESVGVGYTVVETVIDGTPTTVLHVWLKSTASRKEIYTTCLTSDLISLVPEFGEDIVVVEPTDITYASNPVTAYITRTEYESYLDDIIDHIEALD